jgi:hypothetical protein
MHGDYGVCAIGDLKGHPLIISPVGFKRFRKEPVEVIPSPEFGTGLSSTSAVIAYDTRNVDVIEFVSEKTNTRRQLLYPEQDGSEHGVFVRFSEFVVYVPTENVTSQEEHHPGIIKSGEIFLGKKDRLLKEALKPENSDVSVIGIPALDLIGVDDLIKVRVRKHRTNYANIVALTLGAEPCGWLDTAAFEFGEKSKLMFERVKARLKFLHMGLRNLCISLMPGSSTK